MAPPERQRPKPREAARVVLAQLPRTFGLVSRAGPRNTVTIVLLSARSGLLPLALAWVGQHIIDGVVRAAASGAAIDRERVLRWVAIELGLMIASGLVGRAHGIARTVLSGKLGFDTNVAILEKAMTLELPAYEDPATYDKLQNARREASARPLNLFTKAIDVVTQSVTLASIAAVLVGFDARALLVLFAASIPMLIAEARFAGETFSLYSWRAPEGRRLTYYEWVLTRDTHVKEVKLYGLGPWFLAKYKALYGSFFEAERKLATKRATWGFVLGVLATAAFYGIYAWVVIATVEGRITLGKMTMLLLVFRQAQSALKSILGAIGGAYEDGLFMSNLFGFLDAGGTAPVAARALPSAVPSEPQGHAGAAPQAQRQGSGFAWPQPTARSEPQASVEPLRSGYVLEGVAFRYPGRPVDVLSGIDLTIGPTEKLAIVGENGAGKTTVIKLLTGLYRPTRGIIRLDGVPLDDIPPERLRARIGSVLQDYVRYQLSARDNVAFGAVDAIDDEPRLERAAERGGGHEVITGLPQRWQTQLGRWFEGGTELSAGQWQKLAVSRAFMREADILVLDEPSASLDAEAEHALFSRLKALTEGKMALLVSHRFSSVRMADRIAVIHEGRIAELGAHEALMAQGGRYARLFRLQAEGYLR